MKVRRCGREIRLTAGDVTKIISAAEAHEFGARLLEAANDAVLVGKDLRLQLPPTAYPRYMQSRWFRKCRLKIFDNRAQRQARKLHELMQGFGRDFENRDASPEDRRQYCIGWLQAVDSFLAVHGGVGTMPRSIARRLYDVSIGKVDRIFRAPQGTSSHSLELFELQRRALLASKAIRRERDDYTERDADDWVWARIKTVVPALFPRSRIQARVIDDWRRNLRRRAAHQPESLQNQWGRVTLERAWGAPEPLWREARGLRERGQTWTAVAEILIEPFSASYRTGMPTPVEAYQMLLAFHQPKSATHAVARVYSYPMRKYPLRPLRTLQINIKRKT